MRPQAGCVLLQALQVGMIDQRHHYILTNLVSHRRLNPSPKLETFSHSSEVTMLFFAVPVFGIITSLWLYHWQTPHWVKFSPVFHYTLQQTTTQISLHGPYKCNHIYQLSYLSLWGKFAFFTSLMSQCKFWDSFLYKSGAELPPSSQNMRIL